MFYQNYMWRFARVWYHLYNLKNMKNTHCRVLHLVKLQAANLWYLVAMQQTSWTRSHGMDEGIWMVLILVKSRLTKPFRTFDKLDSRSILIYSILIFMLLSKLLLLYIITWSRQFSSKDIMVLLIFFHSVRRALH